MEGASARIVRVEIGIHSEIWYSIGPYSSSEPRLVPGAGLINGVFYFFFGGGAGGSVPS